MWGYISTEAIYQNNFNTGFSTTRSDVLIHLAQWQYWWWFWFSFLWGFYFLFSSKVVRYRSLKMKPKITSSYRPHGKWGDFLSVIIPFCWCLNILTNSNFILRLMEWQNESSLFTVRIRARQWYWVYKFELKNFTDILTVPKNLGLNRWQINTFGDLAVTDDYLHILQLRSQNKWVKNYWSSIFEKGEKASKNFIISPYEQLRIDLSSKFKTNTTNNFLKGIQLNKSIKLIDDKKFTFNYFNYLSITKAFLKPVFDTETSMSNMPFRNFLNRISLTNKLLESIKINKFSNQINNKIFISNYFNYSSINRAFLKPVFDTEVFMTNRLFKYSLNRTSLTDKLLEGIKISKFSNQINNKIFIPNYFNYSSINRAFLKPVFDTEVFMTNRLFKYSLNRTSLTDKLLEGIKISKFSNQINNKIFIPNYFNYLSINKAFLKPISNTEIFESNLFLRNFLNKNKYINTIIKDSEKIINIYSDFNDSRFIKKSSGIITPCRIIKTKIDSDNINDLMIVRFGSGNNEIRHKIFQYNSYLTFKQKRYKRKKTILPQIKFYHNQLASEIKKVRYSGKPILLNNSIIDDNTFNPTIAYSLIKKNKIRSDIIPVSLAKRLLRVKKTLILPAHVNITLITNSYDIVHSWFIPGLGVKIDCVPGRSTHHTFYIDCVGFYYGQCAEICGRYHHHMPIRVCALPFEHFLVWWHSFGLPKLLFTNNQKRFESLYAFRKYTW